MDFEAPDYEKFPCLKLAIEAGKKGGFYPVAMNAANEEAVFAFLANKINLYRISQTVETILNKTVQKSNPSVEEIIEYDEQIRREARKLIDSYS